jgi:hypothetical protein
LFACLSGHLVYWPYLPERPLALLVSPKRVAILDVGTAKVINELRFPDGPSDMAPKISTSTDRRSFTVELGPHVYVVDSETGRTVSHAQGLSSGTGVRSIE